MLEQVNNILLKKYIAKLLWKSHLCHKKIK